MGIRKAGPGVFLALIMLGVSACHAQSTPNAAPMTGSTPAAIFTAIALASWTPGSTAAVQQPSMAAVTATAVETSTLTSPTPAPTLLPAQGQLPVTNQPPKITTVASDLPNPDDLLLASDGTLYISVIGDGTIRKLTPNGNLDLVISGLSEPEGMILLPDGSLIVAEQGKDRLVRVDLQSGTLTSFIQLNNPNHQLGVDGIALDMHHPDAPTIIIPDSPNGTLLRASLDGRDIQTISSGLARPTGAWVEADGSILVVEEFGRSLLRIRPDGSRKILVGELSEPDDVVEDPSGIIFVNSLVDGAVYFFSNDGKQKMILVDGLQSPQGIAVDALGSLYVTDSSHGRILKVVWK